jgi:hypothetical protein
MRQHLCPFACALAVLVLGCATRDPLLWQRYTKNDFPARVKSVTTRYGNILDATRSLTYGSWTVSFNEGIPYALYICPQNKSCQIIIRTLNCNHSDRGRASCALKLYDNASCELVIPERQETFKIWCPSDVSLEPEALPRRRQQ